MAETCKVINIDLFSECSCHCLFCSSRKITGYKDIRDIIALCKKDQYQQIFLGGQEPFNFLDFDKLILCLKKFFPGSKIIIKSSGVLKNEVNYKILKLIDSVEFPLYSVNEQKHNKIMGNNQAWRKLWDFLEFLKSQNLRDKVVFHTMSLKENHNELFQIYDFLEKNFQSHEYFKIIYPKIKIAKNKYNKIIVPQEIVISQLIKYFPRDVLKEKIDLIGFGHFDRQNLFKSC